MTRSLIMKILRKQLRTYKGRDSFKENNETLEKRGSEARRGLLDVFAIGEG